MFKFKEKNNATSMVTRLPWGLQKKDKIEENYDYGSKNLVKYDEIYPKFSFHKWDEKLLIKLPFRLYNIKEKKAEEIKDGHRIKNYAILSYVWGNPNEENNKLSEEQKEELDNTTIGIGYKNGDLLTRLGYKSWKKAIKTCEILGINYLWVDQLCINQNDTNEKNQEVPKMGQYYSNSHITLVSIQTEIDREILMKWTNSLEKEIEEERKRGEKVKPINIEMVDSSLPIIEMIISSEWFSRSWTFQEGWLSKQTIFMFDNYLIDGRFLALNWANNQSSYSDGGSDRYYSLGGISTVKLVENTKKVATPIGWVYNKNGYGLEDLISLNLKNALDEVKNRGRGLAIDGIYSILGLLPYGEKVKVEYKERGYEYKKEDVNKALFEVMCSAMNAGYGEPLAWYSLHNQEIETSGKYWTPKAIDNNFELVNIIELFGSEYNISGVNNKDYETKERFTSNIITVNFKDIYGELKREELGLYGSYEVLNKVKKGDRLITFKNKETQRQSKLQSILSDRLITIKGKVNSGSFSVLVLREGKNLQGVGLVRLWEGQEEKLSNSKEKKFVIGLDKKSYSESTKIEDNTSNQDWQNIYSSFNPELIQNWQKLNFTYQQTQGWINIGFQPTDYNFCVWLRDIKKVDAEWVLNYNNEAELRQEFEHYHQVLQRILLWFELNQQQTQIEIPPKS